MMRIINSSKVNTRTAYRVADFTITDDIFIVYQRKGRLAIMSDTDDRACVLDMKKVKGSKYYTVLPGVKEDITEFLKVIHGDGAIIAEQFVDSIINQVFHTMMFREKGD